MCVVYDIHLYSSTDEIQTGGLLQGKREGGGVDTKASHKLTHMQKKKKSTLMESNTARGMSSALHSISQLLGTVQL